MPISARLCIPLLFASLAASQSLNGIWDGTVKYDDYPIPFPIEFSQHGQDVSVAFFNGDDRVTSTAGTLTAGGALNVNFDHYATRLSATLADGVIKGTYGNTKYGFHDFEARPHHDIPSSTERPPDISGVWDLPNESPKGEHAWRLIISQNGAEASAAILRVDGDTGTLTGRFAAGKWTLNHFDGARASVLEIAPAADGTLAVDLKGFHNPGKHFVAVRLAEAKAKGAPLPTDPDEHTRVKDWNEPLRFSFPDLNGKVVSNTDAQFKDKVVIVNVTGSWCPNCHDEAPFLVELYRKYHAQGLEIVALDFEEPEQRKDPTRLQAFIKKYGIQYTYLLAGEPGELQTKIPQADNLNSWPTTFFLGRDGTVRAIHAGFAAAASGPFHAELTKEVTKRIETLLSENVRASR
jgi:thiol-disulfide isomerase/thioredoxin